MAGMNVNDAQHCEMVQQQLEERVGLGQSLTPELRAHLEGCPECRAHLKLLLELEAALLEDVPPMQPPAHLKTQVLSAARQTHTRTAAQARPHASRRWWPLMLGAAAVSGLLAFGALLTPSRGTAATLPDPAVVVAAADGLLVASNDGAGTLNLLRGDQVTASLRSSGAQPSWFTQGVRLGDRVYLADAANDRVLEVGTNPLKVVRSYPVPDGVAGLTASSGPDGGRVYFKTVRGSVGRLGDPQTQITVAREKGMPLADVMDGVLLSGGKLFITHHLSGEVCLLDPDTLNVVKRVVVGGAPVDLAPEAGGTVLALDVQGRLLRLNASGEVIRSWPLPGHPDKLGVNGSVALVTDRAGQLTRIDLVSGEVQPMPLAHPMDVIALPDGTFAVAEGGGEGGVRVLDETLKTSWKMEGRGGK
ncbi:hypothetical protein [Deinococcus sp. AJ005]|uniref:hypothetical protein n=1 Tax=Deinococcus sp. AJ005 TaxID=2652443 RepID=UPI00125CBA8E|nr:hypothetical protein [Deinococcus sp. AJ005]QFP75615.1 hypothetical protein DAAJ005_03435 [Deinococcus sp. AJ005]